MFIQVNERPLNIFQLVYFYSRDDKDREGTIKYMIYYRISDGRVLEEAFDNVSERDTKIDELNAIQMSGGSGGGSTPTKKSIIQKENKSQFPVSGDSSTLYIAKDEQAIYYYDTAKAEYIKTSSDSTGTGLIEYQINTDYKKDQLVYSGTSLSRVVVDYTSATYKDDIKSGKLLELNTKDDKPIILPYKVNTNFSKNSLILDEQTNDLYITTKDFTSSNLTPTPGTTETAYDISLEHDITNKNLVPVCEGNSGGAKLERAITSTKDCGAAPKGTLFEKDTTFTEFAEKLLLAEVLPTVQFTASNSGLHEKNTVISTPALTTKITSLGTCTIDTIEFIKDGSLIDTQNYVSGTNSYTTNSTDITINSTVQTKVYYKKSDGTTGILTYSATYTFVNKSYFGTTTSVPQASDITTLSSSLKNTKAFTGTTNVTNSHIVYAYPKSLGDLSSIKDANNFEYLASYTKKILAINGEDYNVYFLTDKVTGIGIKQIYS